MARISTKDPLDKFRWKVTIEGFERAGFYSVEVPSYTISTKEYAEGGAHLFPRQIVDSISYKPVTLSRGATANTDFLTWAQMPLFVVAPPLPKDSSATPVANPFATLSGLNPLSPPALQVSDYRKTVIIAHLDRANNVVRQYTLYNAIPVEFIPASDFSADGDDTVSLEKLVLKYESFEVTTAESSNTMRNLTDPLKKIIRGL